MVLSHAGACIWLQLMTKYSIHMDVWWRWFSILLVLVETYGFEVYLSSHVLYGHRLAVSLIFFTIFSTMAIFVWSKLFFSQVFVSLLFVFRDRSLFFFAFLFLILVSYVIFLFLY